MKLCRDGSPPSPTTGLDVKSMACWTAQTPGKRHPIHPVETTSDTNSSFRLQPQGIDWRLWAGHVDLQTPREEGEIVASVVTTQLSHQTSDLGWHPFFSSLRSEVSLSVIRLAHRLQPVSAHTVLDFLHRDVAHQCIGAGAVPMLLARRYPDPITGADRL